MTTSTYFMTKYDEHEQLRLTILNELYNDFTLNYLISIGLRQGMTVLEYGCGEGILTIELAKLVGSNGKIIAIDSRAESINTAKINAEKAGITNIEFKLCAVENIAELNLTVDFIYGRWVLIFTQTITQILNDLIASLKPHGIIACEELNFVETGHFSYPHAQLVDKYHEFALANCVSANLNINVANLLYNELSQQNLESICIKINQPIRTTAREKMVYRLGLLTMFDTIIKNNPITDIQLNTMIDDFVEIENNNTIIGGYRNLLLSGVKPSCS